MRSQRVSLLIIFSFLVLSCALARAAETPLHSSATVVASAVDPAFLPMPWEIRGIGQVSDDLTLGVSGPVDGMDQKVAQSILDLSDPKTGLALSHLGHPGFGDVAFLYDKAVDALVLKASGDQVDAEKILDYFAERLRIPAGEVRKYADANGVYGILKLIPSVDDPWAIGLVNAVKVSSSEREGEAKVEYWSTPGPLAFMAIAFLHVNKEKYRAEALMMGEALLAMQRADGAITDGDRAPGNVNTEPHMDAFAVFLQLFELTKDPKWQAAAEKAWVWFERNIYQAESGTIYRNKQGESPSGIFATDTYSWTMAGPAGDRMTLPGLERLTEQMLRQGLSRVTLELPDGKTKTLTLVDFADAKDMRITADRGGVRPMGSVEWIGGVILALQKNAVRFWQSEDEAERAKARHFKALAEYFQAEAMKSFYHLDGMKGLMSFYATGQWVATGHGWKTPYFYVKDPTGKPAIKGGSLIGAWPILPLNRQNPFYLDDHYGAVYERIPLARTDRAEAEVYVASLVADRSKVEIVPDQMASDVDDMPELWRYNQNMFLSFNAGDYYAAILWAEKIVKDAAWVRMAQDQQKRKAREVGGLVEYPWGTPLADAKDAKRAIQRYGVLNEVGAAMWGLAVSNFRLGNETQAKAWIRSLIETAPYHQIYAPNGPGFWNALVSWEQNPGGTPLDFEMGRLYRDVLKDLGLTSAMPKSFSVK
ncbi:MAG: hypothetical protein HQL18_05275 [Candidatus Omnitrophica bacterium]|nr:hypothetical protein [Candidatus Omnitrophota bacterium]